MATDGNCRTDPITNPRNSVRNSPKRHGVSGVNCQTIEGKRRKKTSDGRNDANVGIKGHLQSNNLEPSEGQSSVVLKESRCAFCNTSKQTEGSGPFVAYAQGKEVTGNVDNFSEVTYIHSKCLEWTPMIYFKGEIIQNLEKEIIRASQLKCSGCAKKGASLGCYEKLCQRTYHVPCAYYIPDCRWDVSNYLLFCPKHASSKFPSEKKAKSGKRNTEERISKHLKPSTTLLNVGKNLVFCGSSLSSEEKFTLVDLASSSGAVVSKYWRNDVTHVIAATDSNGAFTRTLKVLMAILNGKWILKMEWIKACLEAGHLVKEEPYEVLLDNHGSYGGPREGRLRVQNNAPKLFNNLNFYFIGEFEQAYKADLLNLVTAAGGTIIKTKDELLISSSDADTKAKMNQVTLVVYNADFSYNPWFEDEDTIKWRTTETAEVLALEVGCWVAPHIWILESIACGLQCPIPMP